MFNDTSILIVLALGQMMVLLTKGIDLSMAANLALTGMIVALLNAHHPDIPVWALLMLATLLGLLVWRLGIPAIVVTLGTMSIYRGIIFLLSDGGWVNSHQMSADFLALPRASLLGLPLLSWCAIARPAAGRLLPALQPHRTGAIHRRRQRHGGVLHRHQRRENAVHQLLPFRGAGGILRLSVDLPALPSPTLTLPTASSCRSWPPASSAASAPWAGPDA
nr:L-rhamnose ABC transporter, transmembrane component 2 [Raoultella sp. NCTC 9187]